MNDKPIGPNAKKLLAHFIAREAIPIGGGLGDGLHFLADSERRKQGIEKAMSDMQAALELVKSAPDNPYGDNDEAIAGAILSRLDKASKP